MIRNTRRPIQEAHLDIGDAFRSVGKSIIFSLFFGFLWIWYFVAIGRMRSRTRKFSRMFSLEELKIF
ncbi:MAG: hypothetical protein ACTSWN_10795, partial [Promethearchaeota archaeon]